jgi:phenylacetic acid degradation operon negative regulatory protein
MPERTAAPAEAVDDIDARPGSTTSLLRTVIGLYLRRLGGRVAASGLVALLEDLDVPAARTRTGLTRLKQKGLLLADRAEPGICRLDPRAVAMLERGDRRIFTVRAMADDEPWCLVSFSIPEERRDVRHQLRRRLQWIGCGVVSPALWICPDHLADEVEGILAALGIRDHATLFRADRIAPADDLRDAAAAWWDLDALAAEHRRFQEALAPLATHPIQRPADAFAVYVRLLDAWRPLPYVDPGLPASILPSDWPGQRSVDAFRTLSARLADDAWGHVRSVVHPLARDESAT